MSTTPRTDAARGFHDMDTAVSAEDMAQLETELIYLREENKLLKAAQKISEERDEQLIQEARSLQSLGAILAAYDVSVKTRKRLETELTEAKANFKEERTFLIAEIKELNAEVERLKKDTSDMGTWVGSKMLQPEWDSFKQSLEVIEHWKTRAELAEASAKLWEADALRYANNTEFWKARAEKAEAELAAASQGYDCMMAIHGTVLEDLATEREKVRVLRDALERRHTEQGYHRQYVDDVLDATKEASQ